MNSESEICDRVEVGGRITALESMQFATGWMRCLSQCRDRCPTRGYAGTTLLGDGAVLLVLDIRRSCCDRTPTGNGVIALEGRQRLRRPRHCCKCCRRRRPRDWTHCSRLHTAVSRSSWRPSSADCLGDPYVEQWIVPASVKGRVDMPVGGRFFSPICQNASGKRKKLAAGGWRLMIDLERIRTMQYKILIDDSKLARMVILVPSGGFVRNGI